MIRVLYVITQSAPGGAQRYVLDLARSLPAGFEPVIAAGLSGDNHLLDQAADAGVQTVLLNHMGRAINPLADSRAIRELRKIIRELKPELVHLNSTKAGVLGAWSCMDPVKSIYTVHGWVFNEPLPWWRRTVYQLAERASSRRLDAIIVLSESDRQAGLRLGIDESKLHLIRNGIEQVDPLSAVAARRQLEQLCRTDLSGSRIVLVIAGFYLTKGLANLLAAVEQLPRDVVAVILGDGPLRHSLEARAAGPGLAGRVWLPGHAHEAWRMIPAADVFVLPSLKEGLPYVLLEAMRVRVPIVATAVGGIPEVLDRIVVPPNDP
ncbi:MAG TPA: glycosyltransferase, partial [Firmicutes bacterium]|nr:glycosyltransferase [Bacillota bacterium]